MSAAAANWTDSLAAHGLVEKSSEAWSDAESRSWSVRSSRRLTAGRGGTLLRASSEPAADEAAARRVLTDRRSRFLAQFDGDIGYPGMITRGLQVPDAFRPQDISPGQDGGAAWLVSATKRLTYGVGAEDLKEYTAIVSQRWCPIAGRAVELELFFKKETFSEKTALAEFASFSCMAPTLLERARILRRNDDAAAAAILAEKATATGDPRAFLELALCREAQGRFADGVSALKLGLVANPLSTDLRIKLASILRQMGKFTEAMGIYKEARALDPKLSDAYIEEGYARLNAGQSDEARHVFHAALTASSGSAVSQHHIATSLWFNGERAKAISAMEDTVASFESQGASGDDYAHALLWLSEMREEMGISGSEDLARRAVATTVPNYGEHYYGHLRLGQALTLRGKYAEARAEYDAALKDCASYDCVPFLEAKIWIALARSERAAGNLLQARRAADQALELARSPRSDGHGLSPFYGARIIIFIKCASFYQINGDARAAHRALEYAAPLAAAIPLHYSADIYRNELKKHKQSSNKFTAAGLSQPRGLILVSIDALRADRVGALRAGTSLTPAIDALAKSAVVFEQTISPAPWTLPAMASAFTSLPPSEHALTNRYSALEGKTRVLSGLPASVATLADAFKRAGFDTAAFTGDAGLDKTYGFNRGFDVYYDSTPFAGLEITAPLALHWISERKDRPFFLFLHGYDAHGQHPLAPDFRSRFADQGYAGRYTGTNKEFLELRRAAIDGKTLPLTGPDRAFWTAHYDERVLNADKRVGHFLDAVKKIPGISTGVVIALMSDHGEELFEHGGIDHGMTLYDESLRVPLIIHAPGFAPRTVRDQARLLDLAPTLLELLNVSDSTFTIQAKGKSLRPLMEGRPDTPRDALSETDFLFRTSKRSLRGAEGRKLILDLETLRREVYDLNIDPGETNDLAPADPASAGDLERRLRAQLGMPLD